jgi:hypothetical protein
MEDRISEVEDKINIKLKGEELLDKNSRSVKGMCKNSEIPAKYHNSKLQALKRYT